MLWLLGRGTRTDFFNPGATSSSADRIVCAAVLQVPSDASDDGRAGMDHQSGATTRGLDDLDPRIPEACQAHRNRRLALSALLAAPTSTAWVLAVLRRRDEDAAWERRSS